MSEFILPLVLIVLTAIYERIVFLRLNALDKHYYDQFRIKVIRFIDKKKPSKAKRSHNKPNKF